MSESILDILKKYWGHASFRPLQDEIVSSVLSGKDTIALLPTGGGKSICFQVPAMAKEGVCIVVSPLIALMRDQVQSLKKKGIRAIAINSSMSKKEIDYALDNAIYGDVKFLYVAPERLQSELFLARVAKMKVSLLAIDEAHCISEWGHDFRPAYRQITAFREQLNDVPVIAVTATAVPSVIDDIAEQLQMKAPAIFKKSFARDNLIYVVQEEEHKVSRLENIVRRLGGSGIIYVPTRRETISTAQLLRAKGIGAVAYHGGMDNQMRQEMQDLWVKNRAQVMVATNAFGMGIDKPDVRFVVHLDLPASIEAYFQEAGRAGRDGNQAYAIALINEQDRQGLVEKVSKLVPTETEIIQTYRALTNFFQLALGSKMESAIPFDIAAFSKQFNLNVHTVLKSLRILQLAEVITLSDAVHNPSRIQFLLKNKDLYSFEVGNPTFEPLIHLLLRSYEGIFEQPTRISENNLGVRLKVAAGTIKEQLRHMESLNVISYQEQTDSPFISFQNERPKVDALKIDDKFVEQQRIRHLQKMNAILNYSENEVVCRSVQLTSYFGDNETMPCGRCDVCLKRKQSAMSETQFESIKTEILKEIENKEVEIRNLQSLKQYAQKDILDVIRKLGDEGTIRISGDNTLSIA